MTDYNLFNGWDFAALLKRKPSEILNLMLEIAESSRHNPDHAYLVPYTSIPIEPPTNVEMKDFGWLYAGEESCRTNPLPSTFVVEYRIAELMPFDGLSWDGYVAAGSFAALVCQPNYDQSSKMPDRPGDIDIYPYCSHQKRGEMSIDDAAMISYTRFLDEMTDVIQNEGDDNHKLFMDCITKRNGSCTTIFANTNVQHPRWECALSRYQIIHRAHTSATSVIVGFDQMACKAFYDGSMVYFTLDAAICLYFGINPVDWRRESPSHLRRTDKYQRYGYKPIFPGLSLDLANRLVNEQESSGYYLPGCMLMARTVRHKKSGKAYTTTEAYLSFEPPAGMDNYLAHRAGDQNLTEYRIESALKFKRNYLNLENMPAVPFPREAEESDYSEETTAYMAQCYHVLSLTIREKYNLFSLYNDDAPNLIITQGKGIDVRRVLQKTMATRCSEFYFGTNRVREIQERMERLLVNGHSGVVSFKLLSKDNMKELTDLQEELHELFETRVTELEGLIEPQVLKLQEGVKFITSNPGCQFTASFKPIVRQRPEDYWGILYTSVQPSRLRQLKLTLLCIRKFHSPVMRKLDKNVMRLIFRELDKAYFLQFAKELVV